MEFTSTLTASGVWDGSRLAFASVAASMDGSRFGESDAVLDRLAERRAFAASPLAFDAAWMDHHLVRFVGESIVPSLYDPAPLFTAPGLCIRSFASAVTRRPIAELTSDAFPPEWLGDIAHTHRAIDDARGYAALLVSLASQQT